MSAATEVELDDDVFRDLLTVKRAAEYLGVPVETLDILRTLHIGPSVIWFGTVYRYEWTDLDAWRANADRRTELSAAIGAVINTLHAVQVQFGEICDSV